MRATGRRCPGPRLGPDTEQAAQVAVPPELERFAREQIAAGHVGSDEEAVARVFRDSLDEMRVLREMSIPQSRRPIGATRSTARHLQELFAETKAMVDATERS